ncbi:MAG: arginine--tRNA ligase [Oscillospiraceae bacterium]|nr:arginine--tRNA ligase [Oscillospiraceae bacterium]
MANMIQNAKDSINEILNAACLKAVEKGLLPESADLSRGSVEIPKDTTNGDYAANHAMTGAKAMRMPPRKIAEILAENAELEGTWFASIEVAGPGFINFRLDQKWYSDVLACVREEGEDYGRVNVGEGKKCMVEFVSANPTGPMHMGNARGGVLGDALANVMDRAGYDVWREFYVNDAGNQIEKFATSIDARYRQALLGEDAVEFPEDGYHGDDIKELAKLFIDKNGDEYLNVSVEKRHEAMAKFGLDRNIPKMQSDLRRYGVEYDQWFFESELHSSGSVEAAVQALTERGYTYEKDGAVWLKTAQILSENMLKAGKKQADIDKLELKDDVLRRANGFYTYFAADIAYHSNKLKDRGFDLAINIWGADHHGHVARLKGALDALGLNGEERLQVVLMQLVKLMSNGQEVRMSKRTGKSITLTNLLDDIPVDSARYFFNSRPESPVLFDLELAQRQDNENPVYYVQYAHARICTLIAALAAEGHTISDAAAVNTGLLNTEAERELIKQLALLPEEIRLAARDYDPSRVNKYVTELAARFHKFYTVCRIKDVESELMEARLMLSDCVRRVIAVSLGIIGVSAPEKM